MWHQGKQHGRPVGQLIRGQVLVWAPSTEEVKYLPHATMWTDTLIAIGFGGRQFGHSPEESAHQQMLAYQCSIHWR